MKDTGTLIVLAFPDTFVTMSEEWICKVLPLVGLGTREHIKAGHAAQVLINNSTGEACYFDFGRYVTPKGYGRVRGENTDAELQIPFQAKMSEDRTLQNLDEFLLWLEDHPEKTHGEGRLLASVCTSIDFFKAEAYIKGLQQKGSIPYGAFDKTGSNCSRFVTDTILAATSDEKIKKALAFNKRFTPSTVGNVEKSASMGAVFEVIDGVIKQFSGSAFKENLTNYFDKKKPICLYGVDGDGVDCPVDSQKLSGTGSNAWFQCLNEVNLPPYHFRIKRFNDFAQLDYDGVYVSEEFDRTKPFQFTYDSHCEFCHVLQAGRRIKLRGVGAFAAFNSSQKVRSA